MTRDDSIAALPLDLDAARTERSGKKRRQGGKADAARAYYDVPMLKASLWKWEIASYFFLGGLSTGAYLLARMAARFGGHKYEDITRAGSYIAAAAVVPCAPLLIHDLGDWTRFHYMLRIFKPKSPMNLGAWTLSGYSGVVFFNAFLQWRKDRAGKKDRAENMHPVSEAEKALQLALDGGGVPLALLLAGYTGVLLSTTATPMWARNPWIGPLFSASAFGTGAAAVGLALEFKDTGDAEPSSREPMRHIAIAARVVEAGCYAGFLHSAGELARPITKGKYAPLNFVGAVGAGLVLSTVLENIPVKSEKTRRALRIGCAVAGLAGGLALRWAMTLGGRVSGTDPDAARKVSARDAQ